MKPTDELKNLDSRNLPRPASGQNIVFRRSPFTAVGDWLFDRANQARIFTLAVFNSKSVLERLSEALEAVEPGMVVSLDFFDTLATRPVEPPEFVFGKIAELSVAHIEKTRNVVIHKDEYLLGRRLCEKHLRNMNREIHGLDHEASLRQIIERFIEQKQIPDFGLTDELLRLEAELEADVLILDQEVVEFLTVLKSRGHRVLVVSDMYLTPDQFRVILQRHGIEKFVDGLFVSGDIGLAKHTGRLFKHILDNESLAPDKLLHIGDRRKSDYSRPKSLGINARWLMRKSEARRRLATKRAISREPVDFVRGVIEARARELYPEEQVLERALFSQFMPGLFYMAYRALRDSARLQISRLYFLSREGITLKTVFDIVLQNHPDFHSFDMSTSVLFCSRLASLAGGFKGLNDSGALVAPVFERFNSFSFEGFLDTWNVNVSELGFAHLQGHEAFTAAKLQALLDAEPDFAKAFCDIIERRKSELKAYLDQEGFFAQKSALVDVGWGATVQRNIEALAEGIEVTGIYIGTDDRFEARSHPGYLFTPADYRSGSVLKAPITETLLSVSAVGSVSGYAERDGRIEPVFLRSDGITPELEAVRNRVIADFYSTFEELTRRYCTPEDVLASYSRDAWFEFHCHPRRKVLEALQNLTFAYDWGRSESVPLFTNIKWSAWLNPRRAAATVWQSPWVFGTLVKSHLGFLCTPITWLLTDDGRLNKQTMKGLFSTPFGD